MFDIKHESLFTTMQNLRYISNWSDRFEPNRFPGTLTFYPGNPKYVVSVVIWGTKVIASDKDIEIFCGDLHCAKDIDDVIVKKKDEIFEICKMYPGFFFILDVEKLKVIEPEDFTEVLPVRGINTIFKMENQNSYFCLVNSTKNVTDADIYSWFLSYIYSGIVCTTPMYKPTAFAKQFLQAISCLCASGGRKESMHISSPNISSSPINDMGDYLLTAPIGSKTERYLELVKKSKLQSKPNKKKK